MTRFESLIEELLTESPGPSAAPAPIPDETSDAPISANIERGDIETLLNAKSNEIISTFERKYGVLGMPLNVNNLKEIAYVAMENRKRSTKTHVEYDNFEYVFPLLDLFGNLTPFYVNTAESKTSRGKKVPEIFVNFYKRLQETRSVVPLDYSPSNAWAKRVKQSYFSGQKSIDTLGQLGLEQKINKDGKISFYWLALDLTEPYAKSVSNKLPSKNKNIFMVVNSEINKILTQISLLASNPKDITLSDEKIEKIYGPDLFQKILAVATSLYQLYIQQMNQIMGPKSGLENNERSFKAFVGVEGKDTPVDFVWNNFATVRETTVEEFYNNITNNSKHQYFKILNEEEDAPATDKVYYLKEELPPDADLKTAVFNYTAENLRIAAKSNHPQSVNVLRAFENLSSHIRREEAGDPNRLLNALKGANLGIAGGL